MHDGSRLIEKFMGRLEASTPQRFTSSYKEDSNLGGGLWGTAQLTCARLRYTENSEWTRKYTNLTIHKIIYAKSDKSQKLFVTLHQIIRRYDLNSYNKDISRQELSFACEREV